MRLFSRYYVPVEGQAWWRALARRLTRRRPPRFPRIVLVETRTGCNGMCVFCNYPTHRQQVPHGEMTDELYAKIVEECSRYPLLRFSPFNINEPLLDPKIEDRLALARDQLPNTRITITTNGSRLNDERIKRLIGLDALDEITVSFQSVNKDAYEQTMPGLKFDETFTNVNGLIDYVRAYGGKRPRITVTMVVTEATAPYLAESVRYWEGKGARARHTRLENRGGTVDTNCLAAGRMTTYLGCRRPFQQAVINFDGVMVLCCADYLREVILGSVAEQTIQELWNGKRLNGIRAALLGGKTPPPKICRNCLIAD